MNPDDPTQRFLPPELRDAFVVVLRDLPQRAIVSSSITFTGMGISLGAVFATPQLAKWGFPGGLLLAVVVHALMRRRSRKRLGLK